MQQEASSRSAEAVLQYSTHVRSQVEGGTNEEVAESSWISSILSEMSR